MVQDVILGGVNQVPVPNIEIICSDVSPSPPTGVPPVQITVGSILSVNVVDAVEVVVTISFDSVEVSSFQFDLFAQNCNSDISIDSFQVVQTAGTGNES